jgi:hypothetical protein
VQTKQEIGKTLAMTSTSEVVWRTSALDHVSSMAAIFIE